MREDTIVVVGDRFAAFQRHRGVMGISAFRKAIPSLNEGTTVIFGQGLEDDDVSLIEAALVRLKPDTGMALRPRRAERVATHKHVAHNILVSTPEQTQADRFLAHLIIDERSEMLADHLTGQHIQGLALLEAARQMWTAVVELFFRQDQGPLRLILDRVSAQYLGYVFPLPAHLQMSVSDRIDVDVGFKMSCCVEIWQNDAICTSVWAEVRGVSSKIAELNEHISANRALLRADSNCNGAE